MIDSPAPSHVDLLAIARAVRRAVVDDDTREVHIELSRLRSALVHHLHAERRRGAVARGSTDTVVTDGQRRLLGLLDAAISDHGDDDTGCNCLVRGAEIELALRRQARLEARVLDRGSLAGSDRG